MEPWQFVFTGVTYRANTIDFGISINRQGYTLKMDYETAKDYGSFWEQVKQQTGRSLTPKDGYPAEKLAELKKGWAAMVEAEVWKAKSQN